jgi:hypothetical protein
MTVITTGAGLNTNASLEGPSLIFNLVDHLRSNTNWTVAGSGNGSSGGMGGDYIDADTDLSNAAAWVVIEAPGGGPQILFNRYSSDDLYWNISVAPNADYSGGDATTPPTAATLGLQVFHSNLTNASSGRLHITAETGNTLQTCNWALFLHAIGTPTTAKCALAFLGLNDTFDCDYPWILFVASTTWAHNQTTWTESSTSTTGPGPRSVAPDDSIQNFPAMKFQDDNVNCTVPYRSNLSPAGADILFPMIFIRMAELTQPGYKGISNFALWTGGPSGGGSRAPLSTFNGGEYVAYGALVVPWSGTLPTDGS